MSTRIKFIIGRDEKGIEEMRYVQLLAGVPRVGETVWFEDETHLPAWRVEWVRWIVGGHGPAAVEIKLERS